MLDRDLSLRILQQIYRHVKASLAVDVLQEPERRSFLSDVTHGPVQRLTRSAARFGQNNVECFLMSQIQRRNVPAYRTRMIQSNWHHVPALLALVLVAYPILFYVPD
jgi:hypothetical protein